MDVLSLRFLLVACAGVEPCAGLGMLLPSLTLPSRLPRTLALPPRLLEGVGLALRSSAISRWACSRASLMLIDGRGDEGER